MGRSRPGYDGLVDQQVVDAVWKASKQGLDTPPCVRVLLWLKYTSARGQVHLHPQESEIVQMLGGVTDKLPHHAYARFCYNLNSGCLMRRDYMVVGCNNACVTKTEAATRAVTALDPKGRVSYRLVHAPAENAERRQTERLPTCQGARPK